MNLEWWILPQMSQTAVRARERAHTLMMMTINYLPPDSEEIKEAKRLYETATKLFMLISQRILEEDMANAK